MIARARRTRDAGGGRSRGAEPRESVTGGASATVKVRHEFTPDGGRRSRLAPEAEIERGAAASRRGAPLAGLDPEKLGRLRPLPRGLLLRAALLLRLRLGRLRLLGRDGLELLLDAGLVVEE